MTQNILRVVLRHLKKHLFYSLLNIGGLATGISVFLMVALYVHFEKSYEDFIPGRSDIYRVALHQYRGGEKVLSSAENYPGVGPALASELPEVTGYARLYNLGYKNNVVISNEAAKPEPVALKVSGFLYADSSFLPMMQYPMKEGNARHALSEPFTAVISERYAKKYFGAQSAVGKVLRMQDDDFNDETVKITGVFKDLPPNTHLSFDVLFSYKTLFSRRNPEWAAERYDKGWTRNDMYTFVRLRPGTDVRKIEAGLTEVVTKYRGKEKENVALELQPLKDIHLHSVLAEEAEINGSSRIVLFLSVIGFFVLGIAWINYINLSTARAFERAREVGVRKVMGAGKIQLVSQFLLEALIMNLAAVVLAWSVVLLLLPFFNSLSGLSLSNGSCFRGWFLGWLAFVWLGGTFLSGLYPSLVLSSFRPVAVLKGQLKHSTGSILFRKGLVVIQFVASIVLIAGTVIIYRQLHFMMNSDIGMNIQQVVVLERPGKIERSHVRQSIDVFRNGLEQDPARSHEGHIAFQLHLRL